MTQPVSPAREWRKVLILAALLAAVAWATQAWTGRQQAALAQRLAEQAQPGDIVMLSSTTCGICTQARRWFEAEQVPFEECFIERNTACAERFARLMAPGTPVIIVRGQAQLGFDPQRIAAALAAAPAAGAAPR
jgi:glutaredoxin